MPRSKCPYCGFMYGNLTAKDMIRCCKCAKEHPAPVKVEKKKKK